MVIGPVSPPTTSLTKVFSQIPSFAAWVSTTYSALVLDKVMMFCSLALHNITPWPEWKEKWEIK